LLTKQFTVERGSCLETVDCSSSVYVFQIREAALWISVFQAREAVDFCVPSQRSCRILCLWRDRIIL